MGGCEPDATEPDGLVVGIAFAAAGIFGVGARISLEALAFGGAIAAAAGTLAGVITGAFDTAGAITGAFGAAFGGVTGIGTAVVSP